MPATSASDRLKLHTTLAMELVEVIDMIKQDPSDEQLKAKRLELQARIDKSA